MSKLTKKDLTNGIKFQTLHSLETVFTLHIDGKNNSFATSDILMRTVKNKDVTSNQYSIESITDKYLKMWDIQFGQKRIFKVKLSDIEIVNIDYTTY